MILKIVTSSGTMKFNKDYRYSCLFRFPKGAKYLKYICLNCVVYLFILILTEIKQNFHRSIECNTFLESYALWCVFMF